jgi:hypothetical protein
MTTDLLVAMCNCLKKGNLGIHRLDWLDDDPGGQFLACAKVYIAFATNPNLANDQNGSNNA